MAKYQVVEEGSNITWAGFSSLDEAINAVSNKAKAYYIYEQNAFSTKSCGVWKNGQKVANERFW